MLSMWAIHVDGSGKGVVLAMRSSGQSGYASSGTRRGSLTMGGEGPWSNTKTRHACTRRLSLSQSASLIIGHVESSVSSLVTPVPVLWGSPVLCVSCVSCAGCEATSCPCRSASCADAVC